MFAVRLLPGWRAWLLSDEPHGKTQARLGRWYLAWLAFRRNPLALSGLVIITALILVAVLAPLLCPQSPYQQNLTGRLSSPSMLHWMGTDEFGRDILTRVVYGARITILTVAIVSVIVLPLGLLVGTIAGYLGGKIDTLLMRITDVFLAFPRLVLALALVVALRPGIENAILAIALTSWPPYARIARAETRRLRNGEYIEAARAQGASAAWILRHHVIPLCLPSVVVRLTLDMSGIILISAGLGFLGMGAQPPQPEWGLMVAAGREYVLQQWWVATMPGLAIFVVSFGFNLLGDGLRDVFDTKGS
jgi:peptide/nickel transport system permease protein